MSRRSSDCPKNRRTEMEMQIVSLLGMALFWLPVALAVMAMIKEEK